MSTAMETCPAFPYPSNIRARIFISIIIYGMHNTQKLYSCPATIIYCGTGILSENTLYLHYKDQPVNFIQGKNRCLLWVSYTTHEYRGADKSLARPGRKQTIATEDFDFHISYL